MGPVQVFHELRLPEIQSGASSQACGQFTSAAVSDRRSSTAFTSNMISLRSKYGLFSLLSVRQSQCLRQDGVAPSLDAASHRLRSQMANQPVTRWQLNVSRYVEVMKSWKWPQKGEEGRVKCYLLAEDLLTSLPICWTFHAEPSRQYIE